VARERLDGRDVVATLERRGRRLLEDRDRRLHLTDAIEREAEHEVCPPDERHVRERLRRRRELRELGDRGGICCEYADPPLLHRAVDARDLVGDRARRRLDEGRPRFGETAIDVGQRA
jgi:hypothetical protein